MDEQLREKMTALFKLSEHDHGIISLEGANEIAEPFGVIPHLSTYRIGQDRVVSGPDGYHDQPDFEGSAAHILAEQIADAVIGDSSWNIGLMGIGSRLRHAIKISQEKLLDGKGYCLFCKGIGYKHEWLNFYTEYKSWECEICGGTGTNEH